MLEVGFPAVAAFNKRKAEAPANRERLAEALRTIVGERAAARSTSCATASEAADADGAAQLERGRADRALKAEFDAEEFEAERDEATPRRRRMARG